MKRLELTRAIAYIHGFILLAAASLPLSTAAAAIYYVDSRHPRASDTRGGTASTPWKSLAGVARQALTPGDTVSFARGSAYTGGLLVTASGTMQAPITFSAYGKGAAPHFSNPDYGVLAGAVFRITGAHIRLKDLYFHTTANLPDHNGYPIRDIGAVFVVPSAHHVSITSCEFTDTPVGIHTYGSVVSIERNVLHYDSKRYLSFPKWGPIGIFIGGPHTEVAVNRITNFIATGGAFGGADGGAIEVDPGAYQKITGGANDVRVHHNFSSNNEGFIEQTERTIDLEVSYNVSDDYHSFLLLWQAQRTLVEHNTVLPTRPKNSDIDIVMGFPTPGNIIRNNLFIVRKDMPVFPECEDLPKSSAHAPCKWNAHQTRYHNLYFSVDGSDPVGRALSPGEKIADPGFLDYAQRDLHLSVGSPAIDMGRPLAYRMDFDESPVPVGKAPDAGAYEFQETR